jgi:hypothetical protein
MKKIGVRHAVVSLVFCSALLSHSTHAVADDAADLRELKAEVAAEREALASEREALAEQRKRVDEALMNLQDQKAERATAAAVLPPVGAPQSRETPGAHLDVYGFIQADGIYDFYRVDPAWNATLRSSKIPVTCPGEAGCGQNGETILSVRQSRLGFKGYLPTDMGELKTIAGIVYGYGIANYMNEGGNDLAPDSSGAAAAVPSLGWLVYYQRAWNEKWSSVLGYSQHRQFNIGGQTATSFKQADYMNLNVLWRPVPEMFVGPEFIWGRRKNEDSNVGSDSRVQMSFHYDFGGRIGPR